MMTKRGGVKRQRAQVADVSPASPTLRRTRRHAAPPSDDHPPPARRSPHDPGPIATTDDTNDETGKRQYDDQGYWEQRYHRAVHTPAVPNDSGSLEDEDDVTDDWHYSYTLLEPLLPAHLRAQPVMDLGCGLSTLFRDMVEDGYVGSMVGVDTSTTAIDKMSNGHRDQQQIKYVKYNLLDFTETGTVDADAGTDAASHFRSAYYGLVFDKATSDALMCDERHSEPVTHMYTMVGRCLAPSGAFVLTSVQEPDSPWFSELVLPSLQRGDSEHSWRVDVHMLDDSLYTDGEKGGPNVFIITKSARATRRRRCRSSVSGEDEIVISQHFH